MMKNKGFNLVSFYIRFFFFYQFSIILLTKLSSQSLLKTLASRFVRPSATVTQNLEGVKLVFPWKVLCTVCSQLLSAFIWEKTRICLTQVSSLWNLKLVLSLRGIVHSLQPTTDCILAGNEKHNLMVFWKKKKYI